MSAQRDLIYVESARSLGWFAMVPVDSGSGVNNVLDGVDIGRVDDLLCLHVPEHSGTMELSENRLKVSLCGSIFFNKALVNQSHLDYLLIRVFAAAVRLFFQQASRESQHCNVAASVLTQVLQNRSQLSHDFLLLLLLSLDLCKKCLQVFGVCTHFN